MAPAQFGGAILHLEEKRLILHNYRNLFCIFNPQQAIPAQNKQLPVLKWSWSTSLDEF